MGYILASASPRRRLLLKKLLKQFRVIPSRIDESAVRAKTPEALAVKSALAKALAVAQKHPRATVIGADTIVVLGRRVLGKPQGKKDATRMLRALSGRTHRVITGVAVVGKKCGATFVTTAIKMRKVSARTIADYVATGRPLDKAGAYGIQEIEEIFIDRIDGDYDNVVGLPLAALRILLKESK
jgi:septum formation protein